MSVKVPGKGTKGTPFPKFMARLGNGFVLRRVRGGGMKGAGGIPVLVLHTKGAKSGQDRQVALGYFEEPPDAWLIVASAGGASWNPAWLHNLAKDPDATIEFTGGRTVDVRGETLEGDGAVCRLGADRRRGAASTPATAPRPTARSRSSACARARPPDRARRPRPVNSQPPMVSERDYYEVLGVERGADDAAIKRAFRKLAQQWHPDVNTDPGAPERFKEVNEAYQVLSDPQRRQAVRHVRQGGRLGRGRRRGLQHRRASAASPTSSTPSSAGRRVEAAVGRHGRRPARTSATTSGSRSRRR